MDKDLKKFGDELREARKELGLTQQGLADKVKAAGLKCGNKYISVLEKATKHEDKGEPRQPDADLVKFLAHELNRSVYRWLELTGNLTDNGIVFEDEFYQDLSTQQLEQINRILQRERNRRKKKAEAAVGSR